MMGKLSTEKQRLLRVWVYRLSLRGLSHQQIAEAAQIPQNKVAGCIRLGERLSSLDEFKDVKIKVDYVKN